MRALDSNDLRAIVTDPSELAKGALVADSGGLSNLARHGERIYADASGMMASPYKVMVTIGTSVTARCTCMAARTRPFCKHAAALLVAWSRAPEAFAESEGPPAGTETQKKKRSVKKGKKDAAALMADGAARAIALVRELAATGVASTGEGRADAMRGLAEVLRAGGLRRLAGRVHRLASLVEGELDAEGFAETVADVLLTARKIEKHLAGEALDPRHVEELIGKTWRKPDRAPIAGLDLIEIASSVTTTPDNFVVRAQRFVDVATGAHYAEKQIVPAFLARRTAAKPSLAGQLGRGAGGSMYPGYPPRRLDLEERGEVVDLDTAALTRLVASALPGGAAALEAFQEHRKDVFAPDALPVTVRADAVIADGRLRALGGDGAALHLPAAPAFEDQLAGALRGVALRAIVGDLVLDRALPVLVPLALVTGHSEKLALRRLAPVSPHIEGDWAAQARAAGASTAAIRLAEVRGEIADLLAQGVNGFTARTVDGPTAALRELGLERPAQLLAGIAGKPEAERLEDIVRVHQVLGIALLRVVGTSPADGDLVPVPLCESVRVPRPARWLAIDELAGVDRWSAALHAGHALDEIAAGALVEQVHPWWSHLWLSPLVAARAAGAPGAVDRARTVLADRKAGRAARQTAIRILVAAEPDAAPRHVAQTLGPGGAGGAHEGDPALGSFALDAIDAAREAAGDPEAARHRRHRRHVAAELVRTMRQSSASEDRRRAALALGDVCDDVAGTALRQIWAGDDTDEVREAAAIALGRRGDAAAVDSFVTALVARDDSARAAAIALGQAGDVRGAAALVDALASGWKPVLVGDSLRHAGAAVLPALRAAVAAQPALAKRKVVKELLR